jgi:hypothetical protein
MPCDTVYKQGQTLAQRVEEVKSRTKVIDDLIAAGRVKVKVGPQGGITFTGISTADRDGMVDGCIYRMLTRPGYQMKAKTRVALRQAEIMAGRGVDRKVIAQGLHSHDGGQSWDPRG